MNNRRTSKVAGDLNWDNLEEYIRETQRELNKDALGAWRAGYDFLHVYTRIPTEVGDFVYHSKTNPSYTSHPPRWLGDKWRLESSYDLRDLTAEKVKGDSNG